MNYNQHYVCYSATSKGPLTFPLLCYSPPTLTFDLIHYVYYSATYIDLWPYPLCVLLRHLHWPLTLSIMCTTPPPTMPTAWGGDCAVLMVTLFSRTEKTLHEIAMMQQVYQKSGYSKVGVVYVMHCSWVCCVVFIQTSRTTRGLLAVWNYAPAH